MRTLFFLSLEGVSNHVCFFYPSYFPLLSCAFSALGNRRLTSLLFVRSVTKRSKYWHMSLPLFGTTQYVFNLYIVFRWIFKCYMSNQSTPFVDGQFQSQGVIPLALFLPSFLPSVHTVRHSCFVTALLTCWCLFRNTVSRQFVASFIDT